MQFRNRVHVQKNRNFFDLWPDELANNGFHIYIFRNTIFFARSALTNTVHYAVYNFATFFARKLFILNICYDLREKDCGNFANSHAYKIKIKKFQLPCFTNYFATKSKP